MVAQRFQISFNQHLIVTHEFRHLFNDTCMEIEVKSCIEGHHVYNTTWTPVLGECLTCKRELDNVKDRYAVSICKDEETTFGHILRKISFPCSLNPEWLMKIVDIPMIYPKEAWMCLAGWCSVEQTRT